MPWSPWINLELTDEEMIDTVRPLGGDKPNYPPEMRLCITDRVLDKAQGMGIPQKHDLLHMIIFGEVTGVTDNEYGCRIEIQVQRFKYEDEDRESEEESGEGSDDYD